MPREKFKIRERNKNFYGGGVILYHNRQLLLQKRDDKEYWEDFGGKTEKVDEKILETALRECHEESNGVISKDFVMKRLQECPKKCHPVYQGNTYFIQLIYITRKQKREMCLEKFGDEECHDGIRRKVEWVRMDSKLHPRIRKGNLYGSSAFVKFTDQPIL